VSALLSEPLDLVASAKSPAQARRRRLRLVSAPRLSGRPLPEELYEIWDRALTAADDALAVTTLMKVFAPRELRQARRRLRDERRWLMVQAALSRKGG